MYRGGGGAFAKVSPDIEQELNAFDQEMQELMLEFDTLDDTSEEYRYAQRLLEHNREL